MDNLDNSLIARIIASTKRKKRNLSIVEVATDIRSLIKQSGSINKVSEIIGISTGMLNQFLSVFKLPQEVQMLIKEKKIDSVAMVFSLSKLKADDARLLTEPILQHKLTSQELKILLPFRKQHPKENILDVLQMVKNSKNIPVSVIRIPKELIKKQTLIEDIVKSKIGESNFFSINTTEEYVDIKISKAGEKILRETARQQNKTLQKFILRLLTYVG